MSHATNYFENIIANFFRTTAVSKPAAHYIALFSTLPAEDGTGGVELVGNGYARQRHGPGDANWAAPAYAGLALVATRWLVANANRKWLAGSFAVALLAGAALTAAALSPRFVEAIGQTNAFKLLRGWNTQGPAIALAAREGGFEAVLAEDREDMASLLYYTRRTGVPILMWTPDSAHPSDHYQMTKPYAGTPDRVLFVTRREDSSDVTGRFAAARETEIVSVTIGKDRQRTFRLIDLSGFQID